MASKIFVTRMAVLAAVLASATYTFYPALAKSSRVEFDKPAPQAEGYKPQILGVATHFGSVRVQGYTSGPRAARQIGELGLNSFRDGVAWSSFSFPPGQTPFMNEKRRIVDFLPVAGVRPLIVLGDTDIPIPKTGAPFTDEQLDQFSAYVKATVAMTRRYDALYEVWNEYNMMVGHIKQDKRLDGEGDAHDPRAAVHYAKLARIGVRAVKDADPSAQVMVGAVGEDADWKWATAITRYGALDGADGMSVHLYNQCARESKRTADELLTRLDDLQKKLKALREGKETPIYVTEFGWPTTETKCNVSRERSAYNFAHYILQSATYPWLKGSWIYELKDSGTSPEDREDNFGMFTHDDRSKPSACFVKTAREIVAAARSVELKKPRDGLFVLRAVLPDRQVLVLWSNDMEPSGHVTLNQPVSEAHRMCGEKMSESADIPLSQAPLVVNYALDLPVSINIGN